MGLASGPFMSVPRHRALLVDDQALIGKAVARLLTGADDIVLEFRQDAASALAAAAEFRPTVILQDLVMPDIDGLDMVRRFHDLPVTAGVPVIVLSALAEPEKKAELLAGGAADYLVKLPDAVELVARIRIHSEAYHRLVERNAAFAALEKSHADLAWERERSERLLRNILPQAIAERLKDSPGTIAEGFLETHGGSSRCSTRSSPSSTGWLPRPASRRSRRSVTPTWPSPGCRSHVPIMPSPRPRWHSACGMRSR
jgi:DNA-binding response OmpR family regulator